MNTKKRILIIEDDEGDQLLIKSIFNKIDSNVNLTLMQNGQEALSFLEGLVENESQNEKLPHLIILDLNMPIMDGKTFIHKLRESSDVSFIPIVVLSTSDYTKDILECYQIGANSYLSKPLEYKELMKVISEIIEYWFSVNLLPID